MRGPHRTGSQTSEEQARLAAASISEVDSVGVESCWCLQPVAAAV